jgi:hypothetical protein
VNSITKNTKRGKHRIHAVNAYRGPVCGGGNSARSAEWQEVILEPNCRRCAAILQRQRDTAQANAINYQLETLNQG